MLSKKEKFVFADCGLVVSPTDDELCEIAISSAETTNRFLGLEPKVALLSYSTLKSGAGESVDKVQSAANKLKKLKPKFKFEGPIQFDAATERLVAIAKAKKCLNPKSHSKSMDKTFKIHTNILQKNPE